MGKTSRVLVAASMTSLIRFLCAMIVVLFAGSSARATLFTIDVTAADGTHSQQVIASSSGTTTTLPDGRQEWQGAVKQAGSYSMEWDLLLDPDPSISGAIAVTNTMAITQTFTLNVSNPVVIPVPAGSFINGSSAISVADANFTAMSSLNAPPGSAIYTAFINSPAVTQKTMFPAPYALVANGVPGGVGVDSQSFPLGSTTTTAITSIIGIQHSFTLSAGDSATVNSTVAVTPLPTPEPCSIVLAAIGAIGFVFVYFGRSAN
jgi:hypothetical protein